MGWITSNGEIHPIVTVPRDPIAVAELTAALIRSDARQGQAVPLSPHARYFLDPSRGPNMLLSPAETASQGGGQCFDLTRAAGGFAGTHVGCIRSPLGFHVFLAFVADDEPTIYDLSALRGMSDQPDYTGAAYVPIWQPGPGGTAGPPGHDVPPPEITGTTLPPAAWADYVTTVGTPIAMGAADATVLRQTLEAMIAAEADEQRREALGAVLLVLRAVRERGAQDAISVIFDGADAKNLTHDAAKVLGAMGIFCEEPWRELLSSAVKQAPRSRLNITEPMRPRAPLRSTVPRGSCPGSCSTKR